MEKVSHVTAASAHGATRAARGRTWGRHARPSNRPNSAMSAPCAGRPLQAPPRAAPSAATTGAAAGRAAAAGPRPALAGPAAASQPLGRMRRAARRRAGARWRAACGPLTLTAAARCPGRRQARPRPGAAAGAARTARARRTRLCPTCAGRTRLRRSPLYVQLKQKGTPTQARLCAGAQRCALVLYQLCTVGQLVTHWPIPFNQ